MKRDENDSQLLSFEDFPKAIFVTGLPLNLNTKHVFFLFVKAGEIKSVFQLKNSLIIIFAHQNSVESALFYDKFKFGPTDSEINVKTFKSIDQKSFLNESDPWKNISGLMRKDSKFEDFQSHDLISVKSSISQDSLSETHENLARKVIRRFSTNPSFQKLSEAEETPLSKKHDDKAVLSIIKEANIASERNSPKAVMKNRLSLSSSSEFNKENFEFSLKLTKTLKQTDSVEILNFERNLWLSQKSAQRDNRIFSLRRTFEVIPEETQERKMRGSKNNKFSNIDNIFTFTKTNSNEDFGNYNDNESEECAEKVFQPLKNKKTVIGKYYKYEDLVRDYVLTPEFLAFALKIWVFLYIFHFCYEKFLQ